MALSYSLVRLQKPAPIVSVPELKAHLRATTDLDDAYIAELGDAATELLEDRTNRSFGLQQWQLKLNRWQNPFELLRSPVKSIESFQALDNDGVWQDVPAEDYTLDETSEPALLYLNQGASWPVKQSGLRTITIVYNCGMDEPAALAKQFIKLTVGHWYEHRESVIVGTSANEIPQAAEMLLHHLRLGVYP